ncbi:hypothetical protein OT109_02285 [Phycisphaeraceae bacterium D3-23]
MVLRFLFVVIVLAAVGAGMLGMRQQQLTHMHATTVIHGQMRDHRKEIKDYQIRIESLKEPARLREAIRRLDLQLEPIGEEPSAQNDAVARGTP